MTDEFTDRTWIGPEGLVPTFEQRVDRCTESGCWEWTSYTSNGYGQLKLAPGDVVMAHRLAYRIYIGPIPDDLQINHKCHNRSCVNPDHLYAGTQQENVDDAIERGPYIESIRGESNNHAKLTADDVREIRKINAKTSVTHSELAEQFGVNSSTITRIVNRETRDHVEVEL